MKKGFILVLIAFCLSSQISIAQTIMGENLEGKRLEQELDSLERVLRHNYYSGQYNKVIEDAPDLIKRVERVNNATIARRIRTSLGNTFVNLGDIDKAREIFRITLKKAQEDKDTFSIMSAYTSLGIGYMKSDMSKAIEYFERTRMLGHKAKMNIFVISTGINLTELYLDNNLPVKAQQELDKIIPLMNLEYPNAKETEANIYFEQGAILVQQGKYDQAISYLNKAIRVGKNSYVEEIHIKTLEYLIEAYDKTSKYRELNAIRKQYDSLRDKRYEDDKVKYQQVAVAKFKLDQVEEQLKISQVETEFAEHRASQSKMLSFMASTIGILLLIFTVFLLYYRHKRGSLVRDLKIKNKQYLEAKEKSEKLARVKTQFLSTISHELRTPLYGITGLSSVLIKNPKLKDQLENLVPLKASADYLLSLINDVLHLNKLESQIGKEVHNVYFKLQDIIQTTVQTFAFINEQHNNKVVVHIDHQISPVLNGDRTKIVQILMNLVGNASKFTQDGVINIEVRQKKVIDNQVIISFIVEDTGMGIPKEQQDKIFDEFAQISNISDYQGTGLGLPIVNKILKVLDSSLEFESTFGEGTKFSFDLSLVEGLENDLENLDYYEYKKQLVGKKILIVEDNKINQIVTQKVLEQYDMHHVTANNGLEAIDCVNKEEFDIILMDINMPVMNGLESSKAIRELGISTPIIALTAVSSDDFKEELSDYGINHAILKPYKTEILLDGIFENLSLNSLGTGPDKLAV